MRSISLQGILRKRRNQHWRQLKLHGCEQISQGLSSRHISPGTRLDLDVHWKSELRTTHYEGLGSGDTLTHEIGTMPTTGIQRQQVGIAAISHQSGAVGGSIQRVVVNDYQSAIGAEHDVEFDTAGEACGHIERHQRILGSQATATTMRQHSTKWPAGLDAFMCFFQNMLHRHQGAPYIAVMNSIQTLFNFNKIMIARRLLLVLMLPLLTGCEFLYDLLEIPNPQKEAATRQAEGRAIGSACRHSGRSLEDCYLLNPEAEKASVFAGWREMNDYMLMNEMEVVPSLLPQPGERPPASAGSPDNPFGPSEIIIPPELLPPPGATGN